MQLAYVIESFHLECIGSTSDFKFCLNIFFSPFKHSTIGSYNSLILCYYVHVKTAFHKTLHEKCTFLHKNLQFLLMWQSLCTCLSFINVVNHMKEKKLLKQFLKTRMYNCSEFLKHCSFISRRLVWIMSLHLLDAVQERNRSILRCHCNTHKLGHILFFKLTFKVVSLCTDTSNKARKYEYSDYFVHFLTS